MITGLFSAPGTSRWPIRLRASVIHRMSTSELSLEGTLPQKGMLGQQCAKWA
jgi:hypothetical protein